MNQAIYLHLVIWLKTANYATFEGLMTKHSEKEVYFLNGDI